MNILGLIIIGFVVGLIARFIKPGKDQMGLIYTTVLGIVGAFVGLFIGQAFGFYHSGEPVGFVGAIMGSVLVLFIVEMVNRKRVSQ